ncbi:MAG: hypothetical protein AB8B61_07570 [Cyclobacteriaceae bacterium]
MRKALLIVCITFTSKFLITSCCKGVSENYSVRFIAAKLFGNDSLDKESFKLNLIILSERNSIVSINDLKSLGISNAIACSEDISFEYQDTISNIEILGIDLSTQDTIDLTANIETYESYPNAPLTNLLELFPLKYSNNTHFVLSFKETSNFVDSMSFTAKTSITPKDTVFSSNTAAVFFNKRL